jgi:hypothetical protein
VGTLSPWIKSRVSISVFLFWKFNQPFPSNLEGTLIGRGFMRPKGRILRART